MALVEMTILLVLEDLYLVNHLKVLVEEVVEQVHRVGLVAVVEEVVVVT